jgi:hypothetical protein
MERWKPIPGFEGFYDVSDVGRVRSVPRIIEIGGQRAYRRSVGARILKPGKGVRGHLHLCLWMQHEKRQLGLHVAVLLAFAGPRPEGMYACHRDGDPSNNALENLYWGTPAENVADAKRHGTFRSREPKLTVEQVRQIRALAAGATRNALARQFNVSQAQISRIALGQHWRGMA